MKENWKLFDVIVATKSFSIVEEGVKYTILEKSGHKIKIVKTYSDNFDTIIEEWFEKDNFITEEEFENK